MKVAAFYGRKTIVVGEGAWIEGVPREDDNSVTHIEMVDHTGSGYNFVDIHHSSGHVVRLTIVAGDGWLIVPPEHEDLDIAERMERNRESSDAPGLEPDDHG